MLYVAVHVGGWEAVVYRLYSGKECLAVGIARRIMLLLLLIWLLGQVNKGFWAGCIHVVVASAVCGLRLRFGHQTFGDITGRFRC